MGLQDRFAEALKEEPLDLVRAATLLGRLGTPPPDVGEVIAELDRMGTEVKERLRDLPRSTERIAGLNRYLFDEVGFRGNEETYYDPRNSFLGEVLTRKKGLPITLSLVYVEVGRRAGLPLAGVGFPGHFIVRYEDEGGAIFLDPFHRGRVLAEDQLRELTPRGSEGVSPLEPSLLRPATEREILIRMLHNLKAVYMSSEDFEKVLQVLDLLLLLDPKSPLDLRDRGLVYYELDDFLRARKDLSAYVKRDPMAGDAEVIREHLNVIESRLRMFR